MVLDRSRQEEVGGYGQFLLGQGVDKLYHWFGDQQNVAQRIGAIDKHFAQLKQNGIVGADYTLKDKAALTRMLKRLANSGRADQYGDTKSDRSSEMLQASGTLTQRDVQLKEHLAKLDLFGSQVQSLHASVTAARKDIEAYYTKRAVAAAQNEKAAIEKEKAEVLMWVNAIFDIAAAGMTVWKGVADIRSPDGGTDEGKQTALGGGVGILKAVGGLIVNKIYASKIAAASAKITALKGKLAGQEAASLRAKLASLQTSLGGYQKMIATLQPLTARYLQMKQAALGAFGSEAGEALANMKDGAKLPKNDPFSGSSPGSRGNIQRVFANVLEYEVVEALTRSLKWPEIHGQIPLGGYLNARRPTKRIVGRMAREAAKLRWWHARIGGITGLLAQIRTAVDDIGNNTRSK